MHKDGLPTEAAHQDIGPFPRTADAKEGTSLLRATWKRVGLILFI